MKYDIPYLNHFLILNDFKDKFATPLINIIKSNIEREEYIRIMQERYK